ncbi:MAG: U32 family peptidase [Lachnospiraceae bacterium]|nr:U32 family peptidase [Lachnospiraceae bacterium]
MSGFELLAPAGSIESLKAAVNAGADAVYIGGAAFGARAYADNPDEDALIEGIRYCHVRGRRVYLTVNTLFKEDELENRLFSFLCPYYEAGIDAVIVQDIGAISFINDRFPGLPIHLSTQTSITMAEGAQELKESFPGITRVVPARELSLEELRRFKHDTGLEMEVFIHGALCYCYSGQCLMSSMIGGRSGNRGRCAQPCRRMYDGKYLLSPKDQCLLPVLHELMDIGIDSFKIEGRMKSPEYTAGVVSVYRRYMDKYEELGAAGYAEWLVSHKAELDADIMLLQDLYNRGGFNSGYLHEHNGQDMMTFDRPNHSGTLIGEVITVRGREAVIRFKNEVFAQDVLEIRADDKKVFEFTLGQGFAAGQTFSCITMKDRKAAVGMAVYRTRPNSLLERIRADFIDKSVRVPVKIRFTGHLGAPSELVMSARGSGVDDVCEYTDIRIMGAVVESALKAPSDAASVVKQLSKLGETDFCVDGEIEVDIDDNVFIPSGELNRMRREAADELRNLLIRRFERTADDTCESAPEVPDDAGALDRNESDNGMESGRPAADDTFENMDVARLKNRIFSVWNERQLDAVVDVLQNELSCNMDAEGAEAGSDTRADIYYSISNLDISVIDSLAAKLGSNPNITLWLGLPYISRSVVYDRMKAYIAAVTERYPAIGFVARTREEIHLLKSFCTRYRTDYNLYVMNSRTAGLVDTDYTLPQELSYNELKSVICDSDSPDPAQSHKPELIIYGSQPVMFSAQCVYTNKTGRCRLAEDSRQTDSTGMLPSSGTALTDFIAITDELGHDFRCRQVCDFCYNIIYNSAVLDLRDCTDEINALNLRAVRYDFTFEQPEDIRAIISGEPLPSREPVTHGHFHRGIK